MDFRCWPGQCKTLRYIVTNKKILGATVMEDVRKRSDGAGVKRDVDIPGDELSWAG